MMYMYRLGERHQTASATSVRIRKSPHQQIMPPRLPRLRSPFAVNLTRYAISFSLWFPAYILFTEHVASIERVTGRSMSPTFCPDPTSKDYILARHWGAARHLQRGQVILYRSPVDPERQAIKRRGRCGWRATRPFIAWTRTRTGPYR